MRKLNTFWNYIARHKYLLTIIFGLALVCVIDENSLRKYATYQLRINELKSEIEAYEQQFERDSVRLRALTNDPKGVERIARERYFMKRPNEEIFIMSTDEMKKEDVK